tara:strand:- start:481 stop:798 length:318 start_codon:yes stop_codon:yes gene_type:complete
MQHDEKTDVISQVTENLEKVVDPEIGINIVDLGLIYNLEYEDSNIKVLMTLTAPNCPYGDEILDGVDYACKKHNEVNEVFIDLTFDPPWNPEKISDAAKYYMGIL